MMMMNNDDEYVTLELQLTKSRGIPQSRKKCAGFVMRDFRDWILAKHAKKRGLLQICFDFFLKKKDF